MTQEGKEMSLFDIFRSKSASRFTSSFGKPTRTFEIIVPSDYQGGEIQINTFLEENRELDTTFFYDEDLTGSNYPEATDKLIPGERYRVEFTPVLKRVSSEDCIAFLLERNCLFVGAQGLMLVQDLRATEFPLDTNVVSMDKQEMLWLDYEGRRRMPEIELESDCDWMFTLGYFDQGLGAGNCLLCYYKNRRK